MRMQRFLAWVDRVISVLLFSGNDCSGELASDGTETRCYFVFVGPRYGVVRNGELIRISGYYERVHRYDAHGNLLSRRLGRKILEKGDVLLVGDESVYAFKEAEERKDMAKACKTSS